MSQLPVTVIANLLLETHPGNTYTLSCKELCCVEHTNQILLNGVGGYSRNVLVCKAEINQPFKTLPITTHLPHVSHHKIT